MWRLASYVGSYFYTQQITDATEIFDLSCKRLNVLPENFTKAEYVFPNVRELDASNNVLQTLNGVGKFKLTLKRLNVCNNQLLSIEDEVCACDSVEYVNLSHNKIHIINGEIKKFAQVKEIIIDNNNIISLPECIGHLNNLCVLNISFNNLIHIPAEIGSLVNLKRLELQGNKIADIPKEIKSCVQLSFLNLSNNSLSMLPDEIGNITALKKLYVDNNNLTALPSTLINLKNLKELHVSNNNTEKMQGKYLTMSMLRNISKYCFVDMLVVPDEPTPASIEEHDDEAKVLLAEQKDVKRLLQVVGNVYADAIVQLLDPHNITNVGIYILQTESALFLWGSYSVPPPPPITSSGGMTEYVTLWDRALQVVFSLATELSYDQVSTCGDIEFFRLLGIENPINKKSKAVVVTTAAIDDIVINYIMQTKFFRFAEDTTGKIHVIMQAGSRPDKLQLKSDSCYVLDCGGDVSVWIGNKSSQNQRKIALQKTEQLMVSWKRPKAAQIAWEIEKEEKVLFKEQFEDWSNLLSKKDTATPVATTAPVGVTAAAGVAAGVAAAPLTPSVVPVANKDVVVQIDQAAEKRRKARYSKLVKPLDMDLNLDFTKVKFTPKEADKENQKIQQNQIKPIQKQEILPRKEEEVVVVDKGKGAAVEADSYKQIQKEKSLASQQKRAPVSKNPIRDRQARQAQYDEEEKLHPREAPKEKGSNVGIVPPTEWGRKLRTTGVALYGAEEGKSAESSGPRLIQFHGRRNLLARRVEPVSASVIFSAAYLLDTGKRGKLYIWAGSNAPRTARGAALALAKAFKDKERPDSQIVNIEKGADDNAFWDLLGGKIAGKEDVPVVSGGWKKAAVAVTEEVETNNRDHIVLYKVVSKKSGPTPDTEDAYELKEEARGVMNKEAIFNSAEYSTSAFVLDAGSEVYVWMGRACPSLMRKSAALLAEIIARDRDYWCAPVSKEFEGSEQVLFKEKFANWGGAIPIQMQAVPVGLNTAPAKQQVQIDIKAMRKGALRRETISKFEPEGDTGVGKITVWRVGEYKKVDVPVEEYGQFYSGDAYVILYTYVWKNVDRHLIYFYQGRDASINDQGASALLTIELDDALHRQAKEIRVVEGKEPIHFLKIFKGKIMTHQGEDTPEHRANTINDVCMYDVRGRDDITTRAVQIHPVSHKSLHHYHVFAVVNGKIEKENTSYVWCGKLSNPHERKFATNILVNQGYKNVVVLEEGKETEPFWTLLHKAPQESAEYYKKFPTVRYEPRLFQCSEASGSFTVEEIVPFVQEDVVTDDAFILDGVSSVFVWAGKFSTEGERRGAMATALKYVAEVDIFLKSPDVQPTSSDVFYIKEGMELAEFAVHFHGWQWTPKRRMASQAMPNPAKFGPSALAPVLVTDMIGEYTREYTYEELLAKKFPRGLDVTRLEKYMSEDEFLKTFKVSRAEFDKFSDWKKEQMKKELNLF